MFGLTLSVLSFSSQIKVFLCEHFYYVRKGRENVFHVLKGKLVPILQSFV